MFTLIAVGVGSAVVGAYLEAKFGADLPTAIADVKAEVAKLEAAIKSAVSNIKL